MSEYKNIIGIHKTFMTQIIEVFNDWTHIQVKQYGAQTTALRKARRSGAYSSGSEGGEKM